MKRTNILTRPGLQVYPHFSEQEILDLQDLFLTYGCHSLTVSSIGQGRHIISLFLSSLPALSRVACLTLNPAHLPSHIIPLHDDLAFDGALAFSHAQLDEFLLNKFYYDFVWVECSEALVQAPWFYYFEQKIIEYNLAASMPILFVSCQDAAKGL